MFAVISFTDCDHYAWAADTDYDKAVDDCSNILEHKVVEDDTLEPGPVVVVALVYELEGDDLDEVSVDGISAKYRHDFMQLKNLAIEAFHVPEVFTEGLTD